MLGRHSLLQIFRGATCIYRQHVPENRLPSRWCFTAAQPRAGPTPEQRMAMSRVLLSQGSSRPGIRCIFTSVPTLSQSPQQPVSGVAPESAPHVVKLYKGPWIRTVAFVMR